MPPSSPVFAFPCICLLIRKLGRQVAVIYDKHLRGVGIRATQYGLLRCVERMPRAFVSDVGRALCMDQTTVTRNVKTLLNMGLVRLSPHPDDPRKKWVRLTPAGTKKLKQALPAWEMAQREVSAVVGQEAIAGLVAAVHEVSRLLDR